MSKERECPKCKSTNIIMFDSDNDLCQKCGYWGNPGEFKELPTQQAGDWRGEFNDWSLNEMPQLMKGKEGNYLFTTSILCANWYEKKLDQYSQQLDEMRAEREVDRQALELAEMELKAMYKRIGINGSNVLSIVTNQVNSKK